MEPKPRYTAARAANVVLAMSLAAAVICVGSGIIYLRRGLEAGWLLIVIGTLPLLFALVIRRRVN